MGWVDRWIDGIGYAIYATLDFCVEILLTHILTSLHPVD